MLINGTEFGQRLRRLLEAKHLTRNQAATSLQIPGPQLSRYLNGQVPDTRTLLKLARWGNCSMEWLLLGDPEDAEKARGLDQRDDDATRILIYGLPSVQEELERLRKLWDNLEHNYRPPIFQLLELLQPTAQTKADLILYLNTVISLVREEHASRPIRLSQRLAFFRGLLQMCRERLPQDALQELWDETGRYLYTQHHGPSTVSYPEFIDHLVQSIDHQHRQTHKAVKKDILDSLEHLRTGQTLSSVIVEGIVEKAASIPGSPAALSRVNWRKSRSFRNTLNSFVLEMDFKQMPPKIWDAFCKEVLRRVLGP